MGEIRKRLLQGSAFVASRLAKHFYVGLLANSVKSESRELGSASPDRSTATTGDQK